jgi:hypothetical protein
VSDSNVVVEKATNSDCTLPPLRKAALVDDVNPILPEIHEQATLLNSEVQCNSDDEMSLPDDGTTDLQQSRPETPRLLVAGGLKCKRKVDEGWQSSRKAQRLQPVDKYQQPSPEK